MVYFTQAYGQDSGYRTESNRIDIYQKEYSNLSNRKKKGYQWHPYPEDKSGTGLYHATVAKARKVCGTSVPDKLTLPKLMLLLSKAQGRKDFEKTSKSSHAGIH